MSYTAVHIPEFPILAWKRTLEQHRQPLVLLDGVAPQEKVAARCERAGKLGVEHGMSKVQAQTICNALFRPRDLTEEQNAFTAACRVGERFTPRLEAVASPANYYGGAQDLSSLMLLDSSGMETLFGTMEDYACKLHEELTGEGFPAGIGTARNAEAALILARSTHRIVSADDGKIRAKLGPLPVTLLPCDSRTLAILSRWGIRTLDQLAALPDTALVSRLGQHGRRLQSLARGEADRLLVPEEQAFTLTITTALDSPVEVLDSLLFVLSLMLETILTKAMERAYAVRSLQLTLLLESGEPHLIGIRPATPSQNREALLKLLNLELHAKPPQAGVVTVMLEAEPAQPQTAQRGLFQSQFPEPDKLDLLLARLRSIAGEDNVGAPILENSHREDAFTLSQYKPQIGASTEEISHTSCIAMRMFRPPQPVRVTCWDNQPHMLFWQGARMQVQTRAGPWHSSGSWWDSNSWEDDLWDVVTTHPRQALRLRQDLASMVWFVVGLYD